jgi:hypothetical protein
MSTANDNADTSTLFIEIRPGMRKALADAVEAFLTLLDQIDDDGDLEEDDPPEDDAPREDVGDNEPSLGAPGASSFPPQNLWAQGADDDREDESELLEPGGDDEPTLGATMGVNQAHAWRANVDAWAHATKRSRPLAGAASGAAIPRWRCAAMTMIGRRRQAGTTKKTTTATRESWTATIWTPGSIRRTCRAATDRRGGRADDRPPPRDRSPALAARLAHPASDLGLPLRAAVRRPRRVAHARGFEAPPLTAHIIQAAGLTSRPSERPDRGCNGRAFLRCVDVDVDVDVALLPQWRRKRMVSIE